MLQPVVWSVFALTGLALGHGGHEHSGPKDGETIQQYAQRHMSKEHHIDDFDIGSFFKLHDLDSNEFWDKDEIQAIYGVHHAYSQKLSKSEEEHRKKADHIAKTVFELLDANKDGWVSQKEFAAVGLDGLPNFDSLGAEGHHYDVESEFFLHHEEEFHSTPETQTDESYVHAEDLEHFAQHEKIEREETQREADFQGVTVEELAEAQLAAEVAAEKAAAESAAEASQNEAPSEVSGDDSSKPGKPKVTRIVPPERQDPSIKYQQAKQESHKQAPWGEGEGGFSPPSKPAERLRRGAPYKYKFKRNWGDF